MNDLDDFLMDDSGYWQAPDFILTDIITTMVNMMEMPVGLTIFMNGMILSGSLVSERQYLATLSQVFQNIARMSLESDGAEPTESDLQTMFDFTSLAENDYSAIFGDEDDEEEDDDDAVKVDAPKDEVPLFGDEEDDVDDDDMFDMYEAGKRAVRPVRFMHMKDVMVLYPGASIGFRHSILPIVRLRVNSIDGWILGQALDADSIGDGDDLPRPMVH